MRGLYQAMENYQIGLGKKFSFCTFVQLQSKACDLILCYYILMSNNCSYYFLKICNLRTFCFDNYVVKMWKWGPTFELFYLFMSVLEIFYRSFLQLNVFQKLSFNPFEKRTFRVFTLQGNSKQFHKTHKALCIYFSTEIRQPKICFTHIDVLDFHFTSRNNPPTRTIKDLEPLPQKYQRFFLETRES